MHRRDRFRLTVITLVMAIGVGLFLVDNRISRRNRLERIADVLAVRELGSELKGEAGSSLLTLWFEDDARFRDVAVGNLTMPKHVSWRFVLMPVDITAASGMDQVTIFTFIDDNRGLCGWTKGKYFIRAQLAETEDDSIMIYLNDASSLKKAGELVAFFDTAQRLTDAAKRGDSYWPPEEARHLIG